MRNDLTTAVDTYVSVPRDDATVGEILTRARSFSVRSQGVLEMLNMPSERELALLAARNKLLADAMKHDRRAIGAMVAQMLNGYPHAIKENESAQQVVALYVRELGIDPAVPTWAVSLACTSIRLGQAPDISVIHRPSTMQVRRECDRHAWKGRAEMTMISAVLRGRQADPVLTAAQREQVGNFWNKLAAELKARTTGQDAGAGAAAHSVSELEAMIGPDAFRAIPDAPRKPHKGSIGKQAAKVVGGRR